MRTALTQYELKLSENPVKQMDQHLTETPVWPLTDKFLMEFTGYPKNIDVQKQRGLSSILSIENFLQSEEKTKKQKSEIKFKKTSAFIKTNNNS